MKWSAFWFSSVPKLHSKALFMDKTKCMQTLQQMTVFNQQYQNANSIYYQLPTFIKVRVFSLTPEIFQ